MRYLTSLIIVLSFSACAIQQVPLAERVDIQYYLSTADFKNNEPSTISYTKIKESKKDYIKTHGFFDKKNNKKIKAANTAWAVKYNKENYINLRYSQDYQGLEVYAKYNIQGRICALFIDEETSKRIKSGGTNYGGGLAGVIMKESGKWGKNWKDTNDKKVKILVVNTDQMNQNHKNGYQNSKAKLLTRKNFNEALGTKLDEAEIDDLSFNDVTDIILRLNITGE